MPPPHVFVQVARLGNYGDDDQHVWQFPDGSTALATTWELRLRMAPADNNPAMEWAARLVDVQGESRQDLEQQLADLTPGPERNRIADRLAQFRLRAADEREALRRQLRGIGHLTAEVDAILDGGGRHGTIVTQGQSIRSGLASDPDYGTAAEEARGWPAVLRLQRWKKTVPWSYERRQDRYRITPPDLMQAGAKVASLSYRGVEGQTARKDIAIPISCGPVPVGVRARCPKCRTVRPLVPTQPRTFAVSS